MVEENLSGLLTLGNRRGALLRWSLLGCCKWENDYRLNAFIFVFLPVVFDRSISNSARWTLLASEFPLKAGLCACVGTSILLENDSAFSIRTSSILGQTSRRFWNARQTGREYTQQSGVVLALQVHPLQHSFHAHSNRIFQLREASRHPPSNFTFQWPLEHPPGVACAIYLFRPLRTPGFPKSKNYLLFCPSRTNSLELGLFAFASVLRATARHENESLFHVVSRVGLVSPQEWEKLRRQVDGPPRAKVSGNGFCLL